ncbi:hypothetical protein GD1_205 [Paraglaciecola Antarctic GD virus 1]|nr:hypothetical protein GD1_205 [Paraglaciecola Antarctic GD virus 1]
MSKVKHDLAHFRNLAVTRFSFTYSVSTGFVIKTKSFYAELSKTKDDAITDGSRNYTRNDFYELNRDENGKPVEILTSLVDEKLFIDCHATGICVKRENVAMLEETFKANVKMHLDNVCGDVVKVLRNY